MNAQTNGMAAGNETQRGIRDTGEEFFEWSAEECDIRVQARVFSFNLRVMSAGVTDGFGLKRVLRGQLGSF